MNPWIAVGFLLNLALGVACVSVDSLGLFRDAPGLTALFAPLEQLGLLRGAIALWLFAGMLSNIGFFLVVFNRLRSGALLLMFGGVFFFPIGLIQLRGAWLLLDALREQRFRAEAGLPQGENQALEMSVFRRRWAAWFDLCFGLLLALSALGLVLYINIQHFTRRLPGEVPQKVFASSHLGEHATDYVLLGLLFSLSFYLAGIFWLALAAQYSASTAMLVMGDGFLAHPVVMFALAFGLLLFLSGVAGLQRPLLHLREHYFSLRPGLFTRRVYALYKEIAEIEQHGERDELRAVLKMTERVGGARFPLPLHHLEASRRALLLQALRKRQAEQQRTLF